MWRHLSLVDPYPIGFVEELVAFDVSDAAFHVSEPLGDVDLEKVFDEVAKLVAETRRKFYLSQKWRVAIDWKKNTKGLIVKMIFNTEWMWFIEDNTISKAGSYLFGLLLSS